MKGLLIKDFKLLKNQKQFFLTVSMMGIIFLVVSNNPDFVISYITIMISIFTLNTISYDQYNNGMAYLFTLPITRKEYVGEKYVFGLISTAASLAGVSAIAYAVAFAKSIEYTLEEWGATVISSFLIVIIMLAFTIPLQLKFEAEKSRMALLAVWGCLFIAIYLMVYIGRKMGIDIEAILDSIFEAKLSTTIIAIILICIASTIISYLISLKIIKKKEF